MKKLRLRIVLMIAHMLGIQIKLRETNLGCSHIVL